jgi:hypothetical protein
VLSAGFDLLFGAPPAPLRGRGRRLQLAVLEARFQRLVVALFAELQYFGIRRS